MRFDSTMKLGVAVCLVTVSGCVANSSQLQLSKTATFPSNTLALTSFDQSPVLSPNLNRLGQSHVSSGSNVSIQQRFNVPDQPLTAAVPTLITLSQNDDLTQIVQSANGPVIIDFYADWCGPCKKQGGILNEIEQFAATKQATIVKVNVDQHKQLAEQFGANSLPTLLLVKQGQIVERQTGIADQHCLHNWLDQ